MYYRIVAIGASSGAVDALSELLPALSQNFSLPIVIVVHLPADKPSVLAKILDEKSLITVREAEDKEPLQSGYAYLAPPDYHLLVEKEGYLSLSSEEPVHYSRPSIDVLFETVADAFGPAAVGIVLTGANQDGAAGLKTLCQAGGTAIVQDPKEATSSTMPQAALDACPSAQVLPLQQIAAFLQTTIQAQ